jgi:hypothetical protein
LRTRVNKGNEKNLTAPVLLVPSLWVATYDTDL